MKSLLKALVVAVIVSVAASSCTTYGCAVYSTNQEVVEQEGNF